MRGGVVALGLLMIILGTLAFWLGGLAAAGAFFTRNPQAASTFVMMSLAGLVIGLVGWPVLIMGLVLKDPMTEKLEQQQLFALQMANQQRMMEFAPSQLPPPYDQGNFRGPR